MAGHGWIQSSIQEFKQRQQSQAFLMKPDVSLPGTLEPEDMNPLLQLQSIEFAPHPDLGTGGSWIAWSDGLSPWSWFRYRDPNVPHFQKPPLVLGGQKCDGAIRAQYHRVATHVPVEQWVAAASMIWTRIRLFLWFQPGGEGSPIRLCFPLRHIRALDLDTIEMDFHVVPWLAPSISRSPKDSRIHQVELWLRCPSTSAFLYQSLDLLTHFIHNFCKRFSLVRHRHKWSRCVLRTWEVALSSHSTLPPPANAFLSWSVTERQAHHVALSLLVSQAHHKLWIQWMMHQKKSRPMFLFLRIPPPVQRPDTWLFSFQGWFYQASVLQAGYLVLPLDPERFAQTRWSSCSSSSSPSCLSLAPQKKRRLMCPSSSSFVSSSSSQSIPSSKSFSSSLSSSSSPFSSSFSPSSAPFSSHSKWITLWTEIVFPAGELFFDLPSWAALRRTCRTLARSWYQEPMKSILASGPRCRVTTQPWHQALQMGSSMVEDNQDPCSQYCRLIGSQDHGLEVQLQGARIALPDQVEWRSWNGIKTLYQVNPSTGHLDADPDTETRSLQDKIFGWPATVRLIWTMRQSIAPCLCPVRLPDVRIGAATLIPLELNLPDLSCSYELPPPPIRSPGSWPVSIQPWTLCRLASALHRLQERLLSGSRVAFHFVHRFIGLVVTLRFHRPWNVTLGLIPSSSPILHTMIMNRFSWSDAHRIRKFHPVAACLHFLMHHPEETIDSCRLVLLPEYNAHPSCSWSSRPSAQILDSIQWGMSREHETCASGGETHLDVRSIVVYVPRTKTWVLGVSVRL